MYEKDRKKKQSLDIGFRSVTIETVLIVPSLTKKFSKESVT